MHFKKPLLGLCQNNMKKISLGIIGCLIGLTGFTMYGTSSTVTSNYYSWNDTAGANAWISIPSSLALTKSGGYQGFSISFTANPTHDMIIGLYGPAYTGNKYYGSTFQPQNKGNSTTIAPSSLALGAVIEFIVGGWDNGTSNVSQSCAVRYETDYTTGPNFSYASYSSSTGASRYTDTATPHKQWIIPGARTTNVTYIYTVLFSRTNSTISIALEYIDPTGTSLTPLPLLSITTDDFNSNNVYTQGSNTQTTAASVLNSILNCNDTWLSSGFSALGFREYIASIPGAINTYTVSNLAVNVPAATNITTALQACSTATTDISNAIACATNANNALGTNTFATTLTGPPTSTIPVTGKQYTTQTLLNTDITTADNATINAALCSLNAAQLAYKAVLAWATAADNAAKAADPTGTTTLRSAKLPTGTQSILNSLAKTNSSGVPVAQLIAFCPAFPDTLPASSAIKGTPASGTGSSSIPGTTPAATAVAIQAAAKALITALNTTVTSNLQSAQSAINNNAAAANINTANSTYLTVKASVAIADNVATRAVNAINSLNTSLLSATDATTFAGLLSTAKNYQNNTSGTLGTKQLVAAVETTKATIPSLGTANAAATADTATIGLVLTMWKATYAAMQATYQWALAANLVAANACANGAAAALQTGSNTTSPAVTATGIAFTLTTHTPGTKDLLSGYESTGIGLLKYMFPASKLPTATTYATAAAATAVLTACPPTRMLPSTIDGTDDILFLGDLARLTKAINDAITTLTAIPAGSTVIATTLPFTAANTNATNAQRYALSTNGTTSNAVTFTMAATPDPTTAQNLCIKIFTKSAADDANETSLLYTANVAATSSLTIADPALQLIYGSGIWQNNTAQRIINNITSATDITAESITFGATDQSKLSLFWQQASGSATSVSANLSLPAAGQSGWVLVKQDSTNNLIIAYGRGSIVGNAVGYAWRSPAPVTAVPLFISFSNAQSLFTLNNVTLRNLSPLEQASVNSLTTLATTQNTNILAATAIPNAAAVCTNATNDLAKVNKSIDSAGNAALALSYSGSVTVNGTSVTVTSDDLVKAASRLKDSTVASASTTTPKGTTQLATDISAASAITRTNASSLAIKAAAANIQAAYNACSATLILALCADILAQNAISAGAASSLQNDTATGTKAIIAAINTQFQLLAGSTTATVTKDAATGAAATTFTSLSAALQAQTVANNVIASLTNSATGSITANLTAAINSATATTNTTSISTATTACSHANTNVASANTCIDKAIAAAKVAPAGSVTVGSTTVAITLDTTDATKNDLTKAAARLKDSTAPGSTTTTPHGTTQLLTDIPATTTIPATTAANAQSTADGITKTAVKATVQAAYNACSAALIWAMSLDLQAQAAGTTTPNILQTDSTIGTTKLISDINAQFQQLAGSSATVAKDSVAATAPASLAAALQAQSTAEAVLSTLSGTISTNLGLAASAISGATTSESIKSAKDICTKTITTDIPNADSCVGKAVSTLTLSIPSGSVTIGSTAINITQEILTKAANLLRNNTAAGATTTTPRGTSQLKTDTTAQQTAIPAASAPSAQSTADSITKKVAGFALQAALNACSAAFIWAAALDLIAQSTSTPGIPNPLRTNTTNGTQTLLAAINTQYQKLVTAAVLPTSVVSINASSAPATFSSISSANTAFTAAEAVIATLVGDITTNLTAASNNVGGVTAASSITMATNTCSDATNDIATTDSCVTSAIATAALSGTGTVTVGSAPLAITKDGLIAAAARLKSSTATGSTALTPRGTTQLTNNLATIKASIPTSASEANAQRSADSATINAVAANIQAAFIACSAALIRALVADTQAQAAIAAGASATLQTDTTIGTTKIIGAIATQFSKLPGTTSTVLGINSAAAPISSSYASTSAALTDQATAKTVIAAINDSIMPNLDQAIAAITDASGKAVAAQSAVAASVTNARNAYTTLQSIAQAAGTLAGKASTALALLTDGTKSNDPGSTVTKASLKTQLTALTGSATVTTPTTYTKQSPTTTINTVLATINANKNLIPATPPTYTNTADATQAQGLYDSYTQDAANYSRISVINACNALLIWMQCVDLQAQGIITKATALPTTSDNQSLLTSAQNLRNDPNHADNDTPSLITGITSRLPNIPTSPATYSATPTKTIIQAAQEDISTYNSIIADSFNALIVPKLQALSDAITPLDTTIKQALLAAMASTSNSSIGNAQIAYAIAQVDAQTASTLLDQATAAISALADGTVSTDTGSTVSKATLQTQIATLGGSTAITAPTTYAATSATTDINTVLATVIANKQLIPTTAPTYPDDTDGTAAAQDQATYDGYTQDAANYSRIAAINAYNITLILAQCADLQAQTVVASALALPTTIATKSTLTDSAQALRSNSTKAGTADLITAITANTTFTTIPTNAKTYTATDTLSIANAARADQKIYDGIITTLTTTTAASITAASNAIAPVKTAIKQALSSASSTAVTISLTKAQAAYATAQSEAQAVSTLIGSAGSAIAALPNGATSTDQGSTTSKISLQAQLPTLSGPATVAVPAAYTATTATTDINTLLTIITTNKKLIPATPSTYTGSAGAAAATKDQAMYDSYVQDAANYSRLTALNSCNAALILARCADLQAQAVITLANALPAWVSTKATLISNAQALRTTSAKTGTFDIKTAINTLIATIPTTAKTYTATSSPNAIDDQKTYDGIITTITTTTATAIAAAVNAITPVNTAVTQAMPPADLITATTNAQKSIKAALDSCTAAQLSTQTADTNALAAIAAAKTLDNSKDLLIKAQNIQNNTTKTPASGTGPNLAYLTQVVATLQAAPASYASTNAAKAAQAQADKAKAAIDAITTSNPATIAAIATLQTAITNAQKPRTPLEKLNDELAQAIPVATTALTTALTQATTALTTLNQVTKDIGTLNSNLKKTSIVPKKQIDKAQADANTLKSQINELVTKTTTTKNTVAKQRLPLTNLTSAQSAKALTDGGTSYAKTVTSLITKYTTSLTTLQKSVAAALTQQTNAK
ncbi:MAG: hypothetical protein QG604_123 [Candidatus Dependentiae bacterium]|nr:hypothetical protein [Candidatus Dependentiae bacterium]